MESSQYADLIGRAGTAARQYQRIGARAFFDSDLFRIVDGNALLRPIDVASTLASKAPRIHNTYNVNAQSHNAIIPIQFY